MRLHIDRAENGYVVSLTHDDSGGRATTFIAEGIDKVGELVVSQLAAAELDRQERKATWGMGSQQAAPSISLWPPTQIIESPQDWRSNSITGAFGPSVGDPHA